LVEYTWDAGRQSLREAVAAFLYGITLRAVRWSPYGPALTRRAVLVDVRDC
jgi:hypothetical protein